MSTKIRSRFCRVCERQTAFVKEGHNSVFHLLMTVLTAGVWLIVWVLVGASSSAGAYRCSQCGSKA